jgi:hypothetical protein
LNVLENSNLSMKCLRSAAQGVNPAAMLFMRAMGKIQPGYIHPAPDHLGE